MAQETEQHRAYVAVIPKNQWHQAAVIEAKEKEIANFKKHKAYEWVNTGVQAGIGMKTHLKEIMNWNDEMIKIEAYTDCNDVYKSVVLNNKPEKPNQKGDQLSSLDVAAVRKFHQQGLIDDVHWVPSELMLCDTLTKLGKAPDELVNAITRGEF